MDGGALPLNSADPAASAAQIVTASVEKAFALMKVVELKLLFHSAIVERSRGGGDW